MASCPGILVFPACSQKRILSVRQQRRLRRSYLLSPCPGVTFAYGFGAAPALLPLKIIYLEGVPPHMHARRALRTRLWRNWYWKTGATKTLQGYGKFF
jgi:hypothetical protein